MLEARPDAVDQAEPAGLARLPQFGVGGLLKLAPVRLTVDVPAGAQVALEEQPHLL